MNIVMTGDGRFIELQATAEKTPFDDGGMNALLELGRDGIRTLLELQALAIAQS